MCKHVKDMSRRRSGLVACMSSPLVIVYCIIKRLLMSNMRVGTENQIYDVCLTVVMFFFFKCIGENVV